MLITLTGTEEANNRSVVAPCVPVPERLLWTELRHLSCLRLHNNLLGDLLLRSSPYLYPFVIEYALIGATVALLVWRSSAGTEREERAELRLPDPRAFLSKMELSHSLRGAAAAAAAGAVIIVLDGINLALFFGAPGGERQEVVSWRTLNNNKIFFIILIITVFSPLIRFKDQHVEFTSKIINTLVNGIGVLVLAGGQIQILKLETKEKLDRGHCDLDLDLLRFSSFFAYLYLCFTVITGAFNRHQDFPGGLHIANGVVEATQVTLQLVFLMELKDKASTASTRKDNFRKSAKETSDIVPLDILHLPV